MVRCGIIGCGVIAPTHAAGIECVGNAVLAAVCDIDPQRLKSFGDQYNVTKRYTDYHDMLADPEIDLVHVCTDHASHAPIVIDAIAAGKHVLCEKPAGHDDADLAAMAEAAAKHPELVTSGVFQHRFVKQNIALKELVEDNAFGKMLMVTLSFCCLRTDDYYTQDAWRGTLKYEGGGVLINQAIHYIDQLRFTFGDVKQVSAICRNQNHQGIIEVEDAAMVTVEFANGILGTIAATNASATKWRSDMVITGTDATLTLVTEKPAFVGSSDEAFKNRIEAAVAPEVKPQIVGKSYYGTGHTRQIADVCDAIENRRQPEVSLIDAINTASLVMAIYESERKGGIPVNVRYYS